MPEFDRLVKSGSMTLAGVGGQLCFLDHFLAFFPDPETILLTAPEETGFVRISQAIDGLILELSLNFTNARVKEVRRIIDLLWAINQPEADEIAFQAEEQIGLLEKHPRILFNGKPLTDMPSIPFLGYPLTDDEWAEIESPKEEIRIPCAFVPLERPRIQIPGSRRNRLATNAAAPPSMKRKDKTSPRWQSVPSK